MLLSASSVTATEQRESGEALFVGMKIYSQPP